MLQLQISAECSGPRWPVGMRHEKTLAGFLGLQRRLCDTGLFMYVLVVSIYALWHAIATTF